MSTTSHQKAQAFLEEHKVAVLSTVSEKGEAWGAAIYYAVAQNFTFYFFTHVGSKKYQNLKEHPQVALTVADDFQQTTVQASGKVVEVPLGEELNMAYRLLSQVHPPGQFSWVPPVSKIHDQGSIAVIKFIPDDMQFSQFKPDKPRDGVSVVRVL
jgi:nitroimidazol reductase NimA-like FMN-containing flavoprotein (pyridoxamine 5'-phosphate oxidase superfamily)